MDDSIPGDAYSIVADRDCVMLFGLGPAVFLHYLQYWCRRSRDGWCFRTQDQVSEWCGFNARTQHRYLDKLAGVIEVDNRGGRNFYRVDEDTLYNALYPEERTTSPENTDRTNSPNESDKMSEADNKEVNKEEGTRKKKDWKDFYPMVLESWNEFAKANGLSTIVSITEGRKTAIRVRAKELWPRRDDIYARMAASDFLMGRLPGKKYKATFSFLWERQSNWAKVLEGDYDNDRFDNQQNNGVVRPARIKVG